MAAMDGGGGQSRGETRGAGWGRSPRGRVPAAVAVRLVLRGATPASARGALALIVCRPSRRLSLGPRAGGPGLEAPRRAR
jgi:hypothetical protein